MKIILFAIFCCFSHVILGETTEGSNTESTLAVNPPRQSNWEELTSSHHAFKEAAKAKREKFSRILSLLKTALSEELENSQLQITEEATQESVLSSLKSILEEQQKKKVDVIKFEQFTQENVTDPENELYQKLMTKIASAFSKSSNVTHNQNNIEIPTMIPIFRPRHTSTPNQLNQNIPESSPAPKAKQILKSRAVSFVPEKLIQTNISPVPSPATFSIPCQRAADVLDMNTAIPKEAICKNVNLKPKVNPVVETQKANLPSQPAPVTLSVHCADSDDTVAMLFKPKNISLMQLYGNLLKKITITVLVPYHMSKLGGK